MLNKLIKIANELDKYNFTKEADVIDQIMIKLAINNVPFNIMPDKSRVVRWKDLEQEFDNVQRDREEFPRFRGKYYYLPMWDGEEEDEEQSIFGMNDEGSIPGPASVMYDPTSAGMGNTPDLKEFSWEERQKDRPPYGRLNPK